MEEMIPILDDGPAEAEDIVILAHGAGAPMDSAYMDEMAQTLGDRGIRVVRFEFPYMRQRRETGKRRGPNTSKILQESWISVAMQVGDPSRLIIGGKSMGGRIASMVADDLGVRGVICLGYPFHPPGNPERLRTAHLAELSTPTLIVQGTRDTLGTREEIAEYTLSDAIQFEFLDDGDHSFKPRKKSGRTLADNMQQAQDSMAAWIAKLGKPA